jgi:hypothetical protein
MAGMTASHLHVTGDEQADALLASDPNALLIGMVLDQRVRQPWTVTAQRAPRQLGGLRLASTRPLSIEGSGNAPEHR